MHEDNTWNQKTGPEKLVAALVFAARFSNVIAIGVFLMSAGILQRWLATPVAHGIAALIATLPFYWFIPQRRFGFAVYGGVCIVLVVCLSVIEYFVIRLWARI